MNTKRQTIWLVSMLSLMVVLSAYYLFTQDLNDEDKLTDSQQQQNTTEVAGTGDNLIANEVLLPGDVTSIDMLNQQVLEQWEREGGGNSSLINDILTKREQQYNDEENRILAVIADVSKDPEVSAAASAELELLEDKNSRIMNLEAELMKQYEMAIVSPENDSYKVVVASEKMEKKEAAGIIELVMNSLDVKPSQVSVQYVPEG